MAPKPDSNIIKEATHARTIHHQRIFLREQMLLGKVFDAI
jgi:hypothetical protein